MIFQLTGSYCEFYVEIIFKLMIKKRVVKNRTTSENFEVSQKMSGDQERAV